MYFQTFVYSALLIVTLYDVLSGTDTVLDAGTEP